MTRQMKTRTMSSPPADSTLQEMLLKAQASNRIGLRYVEINGVTRRGITVIKVRGSQLAK